MIEDIRRLANEAMDDMIETSCALEGARREALIDGDYRA